MGEKRKSRGALQSLMQKERVVGFWGGWKGDTGWEEGGNLIL